MQKDGESDTRLLCHQLNTRLGATVLDYIHLQQGLAEMFKICNYQCNIADLHKE